MLTNKLLSTQLKNILNDPSLAHEPDAQNALKEIVKLKSVSDLHSMEAKVLTDFKEIIRKQNTELASLAEESERSKEQQIELKRGQEMLRKALDDINPIRFDGYDLLNSTILIFGTLVWVPFWVLSENVKATRKRDGAKRLVLLFLFHCCLVLDDSSNKEGE